MAVNEGQVNRTGIRVLKISNTEVLEVPNSGGAVAFLHLVDGNGNTIVPEYVPQGLSTYAGPLSGAKYTLVSVADLVALQVQVIALQAKQWVTTAIKIADYTAAAWQHVIVDIKTAGADVTITLPAPAAGSSRIRVTEISSDGGTASGFAMKIAASFWAGGVDGHWAVSPYIVANDGVGGSLIGASIELLDLGVGIGWIVVDESCKQQQLV